MRPLAWLARKFGAAKREAPVPVESEPAAASLTLAPEVAAAAQAHVVAGLCGLSAAEGRAAPACADLPARIGALLLSKRFRKWSVPPEHRATILQAVRNAVENRAPIELVCGFGGYKLWRFAEAPEAEWAELFALMHYVRWLAPVAALYEPGVSLTFTSDDVVVGRLNNLRPDEIEAYAKSFSALLDFVGGFAPRNFALSLFRFGSLYEPAEFEADLAARVAERMAYNRGGYPPLQDWARKAIDLNVRPRPGQAQDPQWREKLHAVHLSYYSILKRRAYVENPRLIRVAYTRDPGAACIPVGTTKSSVAKFWVGVGALRQTGAGFAETVLSPAQLRGAGFGWAPIAIDGLHGRNFRRLRILG